MQAAKSTVTESQEIFAKVYAAKDPHELFLLQATGVQAAVEKVQSYWSHTYEIVSGTQTKFAATVEVQLKQQQHDTQVFIDSLTKSAPAGTESAMAAWKAFFKTTTETASAAYEAAKKATEQAVTIAQSNVSAASSASTRRPRQTVMTVDAVEK